MSYKKGELVVCNGHEFDARDEERVVKFGDASLPHSCDSWIIGDADNVRVLIEDLQEYLDAKH